MTNEQETGFWPAPPPSREYLRVGPAKTRMLIPSEEAAGEFAKQQAIQIRHLFEPEFLATLLRLGASTTFQDQERSAVIPGFREMEASPQRTGRVLNLALARPELLRWLERVTGWSRLDTISGRLSQTLNRQGDQLVWHDDMAEQTAKRRLAIVIHLSTEPYAGGAFHMRRKTGERLFEHQNREPGSALVFRVDPTLEHRVLPVTSGGPRRVFAGWAF